MSNNLNVYEKIISTPFLYHQNKSAKPAVVDAEKTIPKNIVSDRCRFYQEMIDQPQTTKMKSVKTIAKNHLKALELEPSYENLKKIQQIASQWAQYAKEKITLLEEQRNKSDLELFKASKILCDCINLVSFWNILSIHVVKDTKTDTIEAIALAKEIDFVLDPYSRQNIPCTELELLLSHPKNIKSTINDTASQKRGAGTKALYSVLKKSPYDGVLIEAKKQAYTFYKKIGCQELNQPNIDMDISPVSLLWITKGALPKKTK